MKEEDYFYKNFILGLGFLSGMLLAVGIDPEAIVFDAILDVIKAYNPDFKFGWVFYSIQMILLGCSIIAAYRMGGNNGMVGIGCAFVSGFSILLVPIVGIFFVLIAKYFGNRGVREMARTKGI